MLTSFLFELEDQSEVLTTYNLIPKIEYLYKEILKNCNDSKNRKSRITWEYYPQGQRKV
jgi:hypothetical protein